MTVPGRPRFELIPSELEVDEELLCDALDHEGRWLLAAELRQCECGSAEGYTLPDGSVACADCMGYVRLRIAIRARAA